MRRDAMLVAAGIGACLAGPAAAGWPGPATPVRFAPERDYGPFVYQRADGRIDGLSVEILDLVAAQAGLTLVAMPARPLQMQLDAVRAHQADLVSSLRPTPERAAYLAFTRPYVAVPAVVVMRIDRQARALEQLAARPVGVGKGYAVEAVVRQRYPTIDWQAVPDDVQALRAVADGRFDAAVVDAASLAHVVKEHGVTGLHVTAPADFEYALSFAVRADWPELRDAIDAALRDLPAARRQAVVERWLAVMPPFEAERTPWATRIGWGVLALALVLGLLIGLKRARQGGGPA